MNRSNIADWKKNFFLIWIGQAFSLFGSELVQFAFSLVFNQANRLGFCFGFGIFCRPDAQGVHFALHRCIDRPLGSQEDHDLCGCIHSHIYHAPGGHFLVWTYPSLAYLRDHVRSRGWKQFPLAFHASLHFPDGSQGPAFQDIRLESNPAGCFGDPCPNGAALLLEALPMYGILAIDVITAILAISPLLVVVIPQPKEGEELTGSGPRQLWQDVKEGFRYMVTGGECSC